ncbi:MAG: ATP-dependent Clp protease adaptor ClpS [Phycisphaerae bacterium]|nr:ATP-dependent Clp protease adaptor ClpS [Phycisphaerae bacterium]
MPGSATKTAPQVAPPKARLSPRYHVVLLDDDDHTYEYVVEMLGRLFHYDLQKAYLMAVEVDTVGRVIVLTTVLEQAEFRRDQIHAYGRDWRLARSAGSMSAIIEPAGDA